MDHLIFDGGGGDFFFLISMSLHDIFLMEI